MMKWMHSVGHTLKRAAGAVGRFVKQHKRITALLIVLAVAGGFAAIRLSGRGAGEQPSSYSFIRTTTLMRGSLQDAVSASGTVGSANTSTVSYSPAGAGAVPKIKTVNVAVGDSVKKGDVIVTLDSSDIVESIEKEKKNLAQTLAETQEAYNAAVAAYNKAHDSATAGETTLKNAQTALDSAKAAFDTAAANVASFASAYDAARAAEEAAGRAYNTRQTEQTSAKAAYDAALDALAADEANPALIAAKDAAEAALQNAQANLSAAQTAYQNASADAKTAQDALAQAKTACNYATYESAYTAAQAACAQARTALDQYEKAVEACAQTQSLAKKNLANAATSDTLEALQESLAACRLTAETDGKVTGLFASVGAAPEGAIATIQDTDALKIAVTISETDIHSVSVGMRCIITSDAVKGSIEGVLSQIDPVAGKEGSFGAEVTVTGKNSGLLIGMNASAQIVKSSTEDCFMVPIDAVGEEADEKFVYRKTGGEGVDMTFEKVLVTTGASNDYYVEILGDTLAEGDVIRSTADLTQGLEQVTTGQDAGISPPGGMMGGMMGGMVGGGATVSVVPAGGITMAGDPGQNG